MMRDLTRRLLKAGRSFVRMGDESYPVYLPSGSNQYPAFWTRDAVWIVQGGLVQTDEVGSMVRILALSQNGPEDRKLEHGLLVPKWAVADHVLRDGGGAAFFPGTYSAGSNQGNGRYGRVAAQDASYQFVEMGYLWSHQAGEMGVLREPIGGISVIERMKLAFDSPEHDSDTQLAYTTEATRAVAFSDAIVKTGFLLEGSILRWRAAKRLSFLCGHLGDVVDEKRFRNIADRIVTNLVPAFWRKESANGMGWLVSATEIGRRDCVRGTCFALAWGALRRQHAVWASRALVAASTAPHYDAVPSDGQISFRAHVRHLKTGEYWQRTDMAKERYQNGGFWSMFTGWYARALAMTAPELARQTAQLFVEHLRRHNFYDGTAQMRGAPWEWIHPSGRRQGPMYLAGLTQPYAWFRTDLASSLA